MPQQDETKIEEITPQINIFQQYLMFLANNRSPFETRRIENMIPFDAYINAIEVAKRRQERIQQRITRFYQNHKFNEDDDDDDDFDCYDSECDCHQYTLFPDEEEETINDLLFKYERQNWAKCENEEECD